MLCREETLERDPEGDLRREEGAVSTASSEREAGGCLAVLQARKPLALLPSIHMDGEPGPTGHSNKWQELPTNSEAHWVCTQKKRVGLPGGLNALPGRFSMASTFLEDYVLCAREKGQGKGGEEDRVLPVAGDSHRRTVAGRTASVDRPAVCPPWSPRGSDCTMLGTGNHSSLFLFLQ